MYLRVLEVFLSVFYAKIISHMPVQLLWEADITCYSGTRSYIEELARNPLFRSVHVGVPDH